MRLSWILCLHIDSLFVDDETTTRPSATSQATSMVIKELKIQLGQLIKPWLLFRKASDEVGMDVSKPPYLNRIIWFEGGGELI